MSDTKFKVGDKARVKSGLKEGKSYDREYFASGMREYLGQIITITGISSYGNYESKDTSPWVWVDEMLEPVTVFKKGDKVRRKDDGREDIVKNVPGDKEYDSNKYCQASKGITTEEDGWSWSDQWELISRQGEGNANIINQSKKERKSNMSKVLTTIKNALLSADEKLLRKYYLKTDCGEYTDDAIEILKFDYAKRNEAILIEAAKAQENEEAKKK